MKTIILNLLKSSNCIQNKIKLMLWLAFEVSGPGNQGVLFNVIRDRDAPWKIKQNETGAAVCVCGAWPWSEFMLCISWNF